METKHKLIETGFTLAVGVALYFGLVYILSFFALSAPQIVPGIKLLSLVIVLLGVGYRLLSIFRSKK